MSKDKFTVADIFNAQSIEKLDINEIMSANVQAPKSDEQVKKIQITQEVQPIKEEPKKKVTLEKQDFESIETKQSFLEKVKNSEVYNKATAFIKEKIASLKAKKQQEQKEEKLPVNKKKLIFKIVMIVAAVLVFVLFGAFLLEQYSYAYLSHDDYGYATLSYVYWEEGMWGQNFTTEQLVHYLTQHYNRWGGRVLSFGQSILLMKEGLDVTRGFHALTLCATFLLAFLFAQNGKKTKLLPVSALFTVALFGFIGKEVAISGFYWYIAAILYTVPILYIFVGAWLMYIMLLETRKGVFFTLSKLLMIPFATVIMFFAGFSMEQTGIFAVVTAGALLVYASFKRRNPLVLIYGVPPFVASVIGCHIMLMAEGNIRRRNGYQDYYELPFTKQILKSGKDIVDSLFSTYNIMMVVLLAVVAVLASYMIIKKHKNIFTHILAGINLVLSAFSVGASACDFHSDFVAIILWIYLFVASIVISVWLFMSKTKQDAFIWTLFLGSLTSQAACLISPVFHHRCLIMFLITLIIVATRLFNEVLSSVEKAPTKKAVLSTVTVVLTVVTIGLAGAGQIFVGFKENNRVQDYNERLLRVTGIMYDEYGYVQDELQLMRLKDEKYTGSTMPYNRDLIKDWMKIYYKLPSALEYDDFVYNEYDEELLTKLEEELLLLENKYLK